MPHTLSISAGQYSDKGRKAVNQDFHGIYIPNKTTIATKGIAIALADGISSSKLSQIASETSVSSFFEDYYSTSEAWSVKRSGECVLQAINSWLYAQTQKSEYRYDQDKGYVCTFSGMILKSKTAHIFHIGDSRIYLIRNDKIKRLTNDHRVNVSSQESYLQHALGKDSKLYFDYIKVEIKQDDVFFLATDGVYEYISDKDILESLHSDKNDLNAATQALVKTAVDNGSHDNLTAQLIHLDNIPKQSIDDIYSQLTLKPFLSSLEPRARFDGLIVDRQLYVSARSHVYLAHVEETQEPIVIKIPSREFENDASYLERFLLEEWVARRLDSAYILKPCSLLMQRSYFYIALEYIPGITLEQWMIDNPKPSVAQVRNIIVQIAKGLQAFHRLEMLHQDLRPANVMIDENGTVKIVDFGSTRVAGIEEIDSPLERTNILGTAQYTAPEYFIGDFGTERSDLFSLAVMTYQMLSGRLPYGARVAQARSRAAQKKLRYQSVIDEDSEVPIWIDMTLRKALHPDPYKRYQHVSEFINDFSKPNAKFIHQSRPPLIERNPVVFWQTVSFILLSIVFFLLYQRAGS